MRVNQGFNKRMRAIKAPSYLIFGIFAALGFVFIQQPIADLKGLPFEQELDGTVRASLKIDEHTFYVGDFAKVLKVDVDGNIDQDFGARGEGFDRSVYSISTAKGGGFLLGGEFQNYNQSIVGHFTKLDKNGIINDEFAVNSGTGFDDHVYSLAETKNGNILVGGRFENYNGHYAPFLAEIDKKGNFVRHFNLDGPVHGIRLLNNQAVAVNGEFKSVGDEEAQSFAILSLKKEN